MNDQQLEKKVRKDAAKLKKDLSNLMEDSATQLSRYEDSVSQLSEGIEKLTGDARETMVGAAALVKKDVGHGLSQYNAKLQKVADKVPAGLGKKAARFPWVAISIALVVGFLLGILLKPARLYVE